MAKSKSFLSRLVLTLAVVVCPAIARAQDYSMRIRNTPAAQAYVQLRQASMFSLGGVGYAAMLTAEEKAFHVILNSPIAIPQFQRLLKEATPEGQLYAVYGLYLKDPQLFQPAAARLKLDGDPPARSEKFIFRGKGKIRFGNGCVMYDSDRNEIIERMAKGEFDQAFKARSPQPSPSQRVVTQPFRY
jgi:hypothetical protein